VEGQSHRSELGGEVRLDLRILPTPRIVSQVRWAFGELALPPPQLEDALLLVSELVTNSIRHAGLRPDDRIRVLAELSGRRLRVDVFDRKEVSIPQRVAWAIRPAPGAESGWGLYLVDRLATRWGRGRGRYWFELELDEGGTPAS
jgi:two-component sensor histidine kinase